MVLRKTEGVAGTEGGEREGEERERRGEGEGGGGREEAGGG